jgi:quinol monooxygenase YgiN
VIRCRLIAFESIRFIADGVRSRHDGLVSNLERSMNEPYLQVIAHYFAKPGNGDRVIELLAELAPATRAEPKNLDYAYFRSPEHPDHIVILERYRDAGGLDAHRETPHFQRIGIGAIMPLLDRRDVSRYMVQPDTGTATPPGGTR